MNNGTVVDDRQAASPTSHSSYEIVGPIERFSAADHVFSRSVELFGHSVLAEMLYTPLHESMHDVLKLLRSSLANENVNPDVEPIADTSLATKEVKAVAEYLGAPLVGVTELNHAWVYTHFGRTEANPLYGEPVELSHRYAISIGVPMDRRIIATSFTHVQEMDVRKGYLAVALVAFHLASYIRGLGYPARAHFSGRESVLHVPVAVDAGLGEFSRMGFVVNPEYGPCFRLATVTTDMPLVPDLPIRVGVDEFCRECMKCADNCPSKAIPRGDKVIVRGVRRWTIAGEKCLKYWDQRQTCCSNCIAVCPWNKEQAWYHRLAVKTAGRSSLARKSLLWLDDALYGRHPKPARPPFWHEKRAYKVPLPWK